MWNVTSEVYHKMKLKKNNHNKSDIQTNFSTSILHLYILLISFIYAVITMSSTSIMHFFCIYVTFCLYFIDY